jgi:hypothetical protein
LRRLIYSIAVSLDGYINDPERNLGWVPVDEEYHRFANQQQQEASLSVYGTRMWQTMRYWADDLPAESPDYMRDFARSGSLPTSSLPRAACARRTWPRAPGCSMGTSSPKSAA